MGTKETDVVSEDDRTGNSPATLARAIRDHLFYMQGKFPEIATPHDWYMAVGTVKLR
jgi:starch phosphorylase